MPSPTSRLLLLLETLQNRGHANGEELAARLGVTRRTLRRYIVALQDLGVPIEGERGVGGGYRIRPGYRLPPLMLSDEEVVAVVLGLLEARARRLPIAPDVVDDALAKINRVLPPSVGRRVAALEATVLFTSAGDVEPIQGETALLLAEAIRRSVRVRLRYTTYNGVTSQRRLSPYGLVVHCGYWYLIAHDHDREALRTFRVDRIGDAGIEDDALAQPPPPEFDPVAHLERSLAAVPGAHHVTVIIDLPLEVVDRRLGDPIGVLTPASDGTRLEARVESLDWMARVLAGLGCRLQVERPEELRARLNVLAQVLQDSTAEP